MKYLTKEGSNGPFISNGGMQTLLGWYPKFDEEGRPLNADPNYRWETYIDESTGKEYTAITKGWITKYFEGVQDKFMFDHGGEFHSEGEEPDYAREYWENYVPEKISSHVVKEGRVILNEDVLKDLKV